MIYETSFANSSRYDVLHVVRCTCDTSQVGKMKMSKRERFILGAAFVLKLAVHTSYMLRLIGDLVELIHVLILLSN